MDQAYLEELGLTAEAVQAVLAEHGRDLEEERLRAAQAQERADRLQTELDSRNYDGAVERAIGQRGLVFSSRAARRAVAEGLRARRLPLVEGQLQGVDGALEELLREDPELLAPRRPRVELAGPLGPGPAPAGPASRAAELAKEYRKNLYG